MRSRTTILCTILVVTAGLTGSGCSGAIAESGAMNPITDKGLAAAKCGGEGSSARPLIIELPAADRVSLEARLRKGLVAVRFGDCKLDVLTNCVAPGQYDYVGTTRKNDVIRIRNTDELYANIPLSAVSLEARLAKAGELSVAMALVGMFEANRSGTTYEDVQGECSQATHVISAVQVGAFELHTGNAASFNSGAVVGSVVGAGSRSSAQREVLSRDGDPVQCEESSREDKKPPEGCGALLRLELTALNARPRDACPPGSSWSGDRCVSKAVHCPEGTVKTEKGCEVPVNTACPKGTEFKTGVGCVAVQIVVAPAPAPVHASAPTPNPSAPSSPTPQPTSSSGIGSRPSGNDGPLLCHETCVRSLRCEAQASNQTLPEGRAYDITIAMCEKSCRFSFDNDFARPHLRKCLRIKNCKKFTVCLTGEERINGVDTDDDLDF